MESPYVSTVQSRIDDFIRLLARHWDDNDQFTWGKLQMSAWGGGFGISDQDELDRIFGSLSLPAPPRSAADIRLRRTATIRAELAFHGLPVGRPDPQPRDLHEFQAESDDDYDGPRRVTRHDDFDSEEGETDGESDSDSGGDFDRDFDNEEGETDDEVWFAVKNSPSDTRPAASPAETFTELHQSAITIALDGPHKFTIEGPGGPAGITRATGVWMRAEPAGDGDRRFIEAVAARHDAQSHDVVLPFRLSMLVGTGQVGLLLAELLVKYTTRGFVNQATGQCVTVGGRDLQLVRSVALTCPNPIICRSQLVQGAILKLDVRLLGDSSDAGDDLAISWRIDCTLIDPVRTPGGSARITRKGTVRLADGKVAGYSGNRMLG
ncbi:hypothetical protein [Amycolatopsis sp. H20-H5]|uniref:hypothetical protein n=1 Tax=Amycolatopsis sp. H20-H5 TaxID=3046309 RepID=UPI002DB96D69|nr:hypothetical protein [Amycolatopsis sp. H20-H5]MEC3977488.1 hypothetical protein [Amycolatopsis sp. H20-H5]